MLFKRSTAKERFKRYAYPHMTLLYNVALKYCGNTFDAEDIVQETYMMAFHKFHQLRDKTKCKPWLLRILKNNFLKNYHKSKVRNMLSTSDYVDFLKSNMAQESAEQMLAAVSSRETVQMAMNQLPEKYRTVLKLYYMNDMLYKEIAATLGIPIGTVMSRLTRAKEGLKNILLKQTVSGNPTTLFSITAHYN